jgi:transcriptional regulator with XRE-family HTH domain
MTRADDGSTLRRIVGANVARLRTEHGQTQEEIARVARLWGLAWSQPKVAQIERGVKAITGEDLLALPGILSQALSRAVSLADLLADAPDITVGSGHLPGDYVQRIAAGDAVETHRSGGGATAALVASASLTVGGRGVKVVPAGTAEERDEALPITPRKSRAGDPPKKQGAEPAPVGGKASVPTPVVQTGAKAEPDTVRAKATIPTPTVRVDAIVRPETVRATANVPTPTVRRPFVVSATREDLIGAFAGATEAEERLARRLGVDRDLVVAAAADLWGRSLTAERDARVRAEAETGEDMSKKQWTARRGRVTRKLEEELRGRLSGVFDYIEWVELEPSPPGPAKDDQAEK